MNVHRRGNGEEFVLVLAPLGRDAAVIGQVLSPLGIEIRACAGIAELTAQLRDDTLTAILTEECLDAGDVTAFHAWIENQPPWSDFPFVVLGNRQPGRRSAKAATALGRLGNDLLLERPLSADILVRAVNSGIRSRRRQYEAREQLRQLEAIGLENRRLYEAERQARAEAEAANVAKDEFLATLSHELRTPLSAILGWTYILQRRRAELGDMARGIDTIHRNALSQARLIDDLLDMSRIVAGKIGLELQTVVAAQLLEQVTTSLLPAAQAKNIELVTVLDPAMTPITGDPQRLAQIFRNLLVNAIKFSPDGATVRVETEVDGGGIAVRVIDSGVGIEADFLPHVFDRFRQADGSTTRTQGGLGLGLAIVRSLVELHHGTVSASSAGSGQGATFTVRLPLAVDDARVDATPARDRTDEGPPSTSRRSLGLRVLLVEDDVDGRGMVEQLLRDDGAEVLAVESAAQALSAVRTNRFDAIVSDIGMPDMDGYELLRTLRARGDSIPAVALTAFARPEDKVKAIEAGYASHVAKPVPPEALAAAVAAAIRAKDTR